MLFLQWIISSAGSLLAYQNIYAPINVKPAGGDLTCFKNLQSNSLPYGAYVEVGNMSSVSVFFVRVGSQISPRRAKKDSNIPSPGRTRSVKCPSPGPTKTIKSPPHALPPPPAGITLIGALVWEKHLLPADYHAGWPLCKLWEHRFSVPDLVSSELCFEASSDHSSLLVGGYSLEKLIINDVNLSWTTIEKLRHATLNITKENKNWNITQK